MSVFKFEKVKCYSSTKEDSLIIEWTGENQSSKAPDTGTSLINYCLPRRKDFSNTFSSTFDLIKKGLFFFFCPYPDFVLE
jgi:hypothetical protein